MKTPNLKAMSTEALIQLRGSIERILDAKVAAERRELQTKLEKLEAYGSRRGPAGKVRVHALKGRRVAPKYRGPKGETWSGRGLKPKWLSALIAEGHKPEEFAIGAATGQRKASAGRRKKRTKK